MIKRNLFGGTMTAVLLAAAHAAAAGNLATGNIRPAGGDVDPLYGNIRAFSGSVNPLYGNIRAFWGEVSPFYGNIRAFWGDVNPLYGNIRAFGGEIDPLYGNIRAFEGDAYNYSGNIYAFGGDLNPFYGNIRAFDGAVAPLYGNIRAFEGGINPLYGNIRAFEGDMRPFYGNIRAFWEDAGAHWNETNALWGAAGTNLSMNRLVADRLDALVVRSNALWGPAVQHRTGRSFAEAFARPMFAKWGIDPNDPASLSHLDAPDRTRFFLDWYDGLMAYAGTDHVDHWMRTINWSPALTQIQGGGVGAKIGLLDFAITADRDVRSKIEFTKVLYSYDSSKSPAIASTHGTAVASLMVSSHDGKGVMAIAPNARLIHFDPFDYDETANFQEIQTGVKELGNKGATVVNLSLGVPNWTVHPEWKRVFASGDMTDYSDRAVFVMSAGNDGVTQQRHNHQGIMDAVVGGKKGPGKSKDGTGGISGLASVATLNAIKFDKNPVPTIIVVGSVDPTGRISSFSNRPGDACLFAVTGDCKEFGTIAERFIVAPGELLLASDGANGIERVTGTSFAAPLVTGAIALLQDRWPWLKQKPRETADIIFRSAKDLGAPGTDPVYGRGLLDVEASQSPLDFAALRYFQVVNGVRVERSVAQVRTASEATRVAWEASGASFTAFEKIGTVERDFLIPLSSRLVGKAAARSGQEYYQGYVASRMADWMGGGSGFSSLAQASPGAMPGTALRVTMTSSRPVDGPLGTVRSRFGQAYGVKAETDRIRFSGGFGAGATALLDQPGFALFSDHDLENGGVNPLLGLASGGAYASAGVALTSRLTLAAGVTEQRENDLRGGLLVPADPGLRPYTARAAHVNAAWLASDSVTVTMAYTSLREATGLLGVQSLSSGDLQAGMLTDALSLSTDMALGRGFALATSATLSRTRPGDGRQALEVDGGGLAATAFQAALSKDRVFGRNDRARLSVAQPLHLEGGQLRLTELAIVDRETGEIGPVSQRFTPDAGGRRFVAEALYGVVIDGLGEVSAFGRAELTGQQAQNGESFALGGRFNLRF